MGRFYTSSRLSHKSVLILTRLALYKSFTSHLLYTHVFASFNITFTLNMNLSIWSVHPRSVTNLEIAVLSQAMREMTLHHFTATQHCCRTIALERQVTQAPLRTFGKTRSRLLVLNSWLSQCGIVRRASLKSGSRSGGEQRRRAATLTNDAVRSSESSVGGATTCNGRRPTFGPTGPLSAGSLTGHPSVRVGRSSHTHPATFNWYPNRDATVLRIMSERQETAGKQHLMRYWRPHC